MVHEFQLKWYFLKISTFLFLLQIFLQEQLQFALVDVDVSFVLGAADDEEGIE
jgi:hypothetical protein